jgi:flagellar basal-body rod modification protein FlgD
MAAAIQNVLNTATSTATTSASESNKNVLGKDAFMKMMVAQLKNQDPLNPMDGTAFLSQLAQFSSLEQMQNLNDTMTSLPSVMSNFSNAQMVSLIGTEATASGNVIHASGATAKINYQLPSDIQNGVIKIFNDEGSLVDTVAVGSQKAGLQNMIWNCSGKTAGTYTYEMTATGKNGAAVTVNSLITGSVSGVSYKNGDAYLTINGQEVAFSDIVAINKTTN